MSKLKDIKKKITQKKKHREEDGRICSLKALKQYSTAAKCDIPKQCQTCSWYQPEEEVKKKKLSITTWKKHGF